MTFYIYILQMLKIETNANCLLNISKYLYITIYIKHIYIICVFIHIFIAECIYIYIVFKKIKK